MTTAWQPYPGNQEPLMVKEKVERSPGELELSKSVERDTHWFNKGKRKGKGTYT